MNVYGMARAFHEAYGIQSVAYAGAELAPTRFSKIVTINQVEGFDHDPGFTETLIKLGKKYLQRSCHEIFIDSLRRWLCRTVSEA